MVGRIVARRWPSKLMDHECSRCPILRRGVEPASTKPTPGPKVDEQQGEGSGRSLSAVVEQDESDPTASSSSNPGGAFEGEGNAILQQLEIMLQRKARFDDRSFRSQLKRNLRRLCEREGISVPSWLEDIGSPVDEIKRRCRRMTKGIIQHQLSRQDDGPASGQPGQGSAAATPASSPMVSPSTLPRCFRCTSC